MNDLILQHLMTIKMDAEKAVPHYIALGFEHMETPGDIVSNWRREDILVRIWQDGKVEIFKIEQ